MQDVYQNIEEYNPGKNRKILIVFDDIILIWWILELLNYLLGVENQTFVLFLLHNHILK